MNVEEENTFLEKLHKAKIDIQINMSIKAILKHRSPTQLELLHKIPVYTVPVAKEGIRAISLNLPKQDIDTLVSFSLVVKSLLQTGYHYNQCLRQ